MVHRHLHSSCIPAALRDSILWREGQDERQATRHEPEGVAPLVEGEPGARRDRAVCQREGQPIHSAGDVGERDSPEQPGPPAACAARPEADLDQANEERDGPRGRRGLWEVPWLLDDGDHRQAKRCQRGQGKEAAKRPADYPVAAIFSSH
jgi:hypothetical protein